ncbi:pyridine nucleotide-disulfide oxidoreductase [Bacteriovorax sp. BAL6_X]|uniref:NAD(P)/FAD-dependent oxidoreductase n=1 Tax=Bacteriovorax sp. BAL6_X TaxID=1201290 RepID=UPI000386492B|nr:NAD(P)/FAD-dependent oxidoreductase [Bacteriovorax sp. BAL6_X]EPZ51202.1 pyridine nucleotide-disulfide oxidoreductase [Bacteriovorax sp. BAL6_X]
MSKITNFKLDFDQDLEFYLNKNFPGFADYRIHNKALDARGANRGKKPIYNYKVEIIYPGEEFAAYREQFNFLDNFSQTPVIIGAGPAGLFCALRLAEYGIKSIIIERGDRAHNRMKHIARFWRYNEFDDDNNVCFGEGGAGLFSDGKLITRIKSPYVQYVMNRFVDFGAPPETAYVSNPHLGSNKIRGLIKKITDHLKDKGCEIHYNVKVDEVLFEEDKKVAGVKLSDGRLLETNNVVLATGHSAKEIYYHLKDKEVAMEAKDFAVGVRIEHRRSQVDFLQYGRFVQEDLGAARYKLTYHNKEVDKGTYSFCMCPGGYVLSSGTDADGIVVNGMSNFARNSPWSNSALVVSVNAGKDFGLDDVLNGHYFQRDIEKKAYEASLANATGKEIPSQRVQDFLDGRISKDLPKTSCPSGIFSHNLTTILPEFISQGLREGLESFDKKMKGFVNNDALLLAPETRTSAPVTIKRSRATFESDSHKGLYPCGEGAGYAGGITSAAVDGVKVAMAMIRKEKNI